jgi:hypothetical protein
MDHPGESASLAASAKTRPIDKGKRTQIWDFAAENSVRIPYLRRSVSRIRQAPLSNRPGIYASQKRCRQTASAPQKTESPPNPIRLRLEAK